MMTVVSVVRPNHKVDATADLLIQQLQDCLEIRRMIQGEPSGRRSSASLPPRGETGGNER
jgi:hypothetical protein